MGAVFFYHLTERRLEDVLPPLLEKARGAFGRVVVRGTDKGAMERLDRDLWSGEGFLPHGVAGGPHDDMQPVLLTTDTETRDAGCLMTVGGATITPEEAGAAERACVIFDGGDPEQLQIARGQWKALTGAGIDAQYWADDGGWVRKA